MIVGVGTDIIEIARIKQAISKNYFVQKVFTRQEIEYSQSRGAQAVASFAARFAAKEATVKALGTGFRQGSMLDIEIINDEFGKPQVFLHQSYREYAKQLGVKNIFLSLSHSRDNAIAYVILEK